MLSRLDLFYRECWVLIYAVNYGPVKDVVIIVTFLVDEVKENLLQVGVVRLILEP